MREVVEGTRAGQRGVVQGGAGWRSRPPVWDREAWLGSVQLLPHTQKFKSPASSLRPGDPGPQPLLLWTQKLGPHPLPSDPGEQVPSPSTSLRPKSQALNPLGNYKSESSALQSSSSPGSLCSLRPCQEICSLLGKEDMLREEEPLALVQPCSMTHPRLGMLFMHLHTNSGGEKLLFLVSKWGN